MARILVRPLPFPAPPVTSTAMSIQPSAHGLITSGAEDPLTWANLVTLMRVAAGTAVLGVAAVTRSAAWNFAGLAIYWLLDILDGWLARRLRQETRLGAQLDILSDRLLVGFFYLNYLAWHPSAVVAVALFLIQFCLIDHYLSNQFLRWPLLSPNYFHHVDRRIWRLNWSPPAKAVNSVLGTLLLVITGWVWLSSLIAVALSAMKVYCWVRLQRLPSPEDREAVEPAAIGA
jgi:CDP-diacylglycerol--glycerol-3-phosphate 3-phosphatidyltransferase